MISAVLPTFPVLISKGRPHYRLAGAGGSQRAMMTFWRMCIRSEKMLSLSKSEESRRRVLKVRSMRILRVIYLDFAV